MVTSDINQYTSEFSYKIINDPIYGCISLSETEVRLLDTRAIQRLRRIRQMGFASYVFPSGEHSRFVHSIGVLCIMGKMCDHLFRKYNTPSEDGVVFSLDDVRKLRIAALLHDVGHFPFSHLSECVYSYIDTVKNTDDMVEGLNGSANNSSCLLSDIANFDPHKKYHEYLGAEVIQRDPEIKDILNDIGISPDEIGAIIIGDTQAKPVYAQLLHSSLDADRLDYLLRDSRQAGVCFGNVELEYVIRQMRIKKCPIKRNDGTEGKIDLVVFDIRGQHAIEHFLMARFFHYTQIVQHKTSSAFEAVAKALIYKVLNENNNSPYKNYNSIVNSIGTDTFYLYTDDYMWELICSTCNNTKDLYIKALWECLNQRKKPIHVLTMTDIIPKMPANPKAIPVNDSVYLLTKWLIKNMQIKLAKEAGIDPDYIGFVESKVYLESIPSHLRSEDCCLDNFLDDVRGAIRIIDKDGAISFLASDNKSLINKMVDYTSNTLNIFVIGNVIAEQAEFLKKIINQNARKS